MRLVTSLGQTIMFTGVSTKMEEGSMRCDANISTGLWSIGAENRVENSNSFNVRKGLRSKKFVKPTSYVMERNPQETRRFDDATGQTIYAQQRRFKWLPLLPEPDLPNFPYQMSGLKKCVRHLEMPCVVNVTSEFGYWNIIYGINISKRNVSGFLRCTNGRCRP